MSPKSGPPASIPFDVRMEMIKTLFGRRGVLISGCVAHVICMLVAWAATGDTTYFYWIPLFILVVASRLVLFRSYDQRGHVISSMAELDRWESVYVMTSSGTALLVGLVAAYSGFTAPNTIAPAIGMGLVGGTMISIVGRGFGSKANARTMTYMCCVPLVIGFAVAGWMQGDKLVSLSALPIVIVITTSLSISTYLHDLLLRALRNTRQTEIASQKFMAAIGSMPNGLVIVDGNQKMIVINRRAATKLGATEGDDLFQAIRRCMKDPESLVATIKVGYPLHDGEEVTYETNEGRWLRFRVSPLDIAAKRYLDEEWGGRQDGAYILTIQDVSKKVEADNKLQHLARYDGLTGLANRSYWEEASLAATKALPDGALVALAVLDVDRFKLINDTLGHHIGDKVIQGVADRIRSLGDPRVVPGRLGGDEFVVVLEAPLDTAEALSFCDRLFSAISTIYHIDGHNIDVRCSGGVIVRERDKFNLHADLSRADMALYKVKRTSRLWMLFDSSLEEEYQSAVRIKQDLRDAIENGALELVYQPIFDAKGERIVSAEALCRWEHFKVGHIPPSQFIAMAEEMGVIGKLTEYVLRTACNECMTWNSDVTVAVNLSVLDLARDGIVAVIANALEESGMPAERLCIEVTETVFVKDFDKTAATLSTLRRMGVKTSLDDFGTGYSSLSYLNRLPLNRVKIDRSFVISLVEDKKAQQLFGAVVGLAKSLGFEVVVEGVEERAQLEMVVAVPGVDMIQGHIFSHGLSCVEMAKKVDVNRPAPQGPVRVLRRVV
jgi:diguanylate cyclase (GGDEF)-like protein